MGETMPAVPRCRAGLETSPLFGVMALLAGCTSWREYVPTGSRSVRTIARPCAAVADHWIDERDPNLSTSPPNDEQWWRTFNDPTLDWLVQTAYRQNLTLRIACFRIVEARAKRGIAAGNLFPQSQQATGDYTRNQVSKNSPNAVPLLNYNEWTAGANLAWELDFWGLYRRALESADARLERRSTTTTTPWCCSCRKSPRATSTCGRPSSD